MIEKKEIIFTSIFFEYAWIVIEDLQHVQLC